LIALGHEATAQLTSTECLAEAQKVFAQIDHQLLMAAQTQTRLAFKHTYVMRLDPDGKTVVMEESKTFGPQFYSYDCAEFTDISDATEAISHRKNQFIIYRTKSTLAKAAVVPEMDKGIFGTCTVRECTFIPKNDTLRHKRAFMTLNEEGQKRYKISDMELVWNPKSGAIVSLMVNFTEKSMWKWAKFEFQSIGPVAVPVPMTVPTILLDEAGELRPAFRGSDVLDYR
jgi:hypothetical protein